MPDGVSVDTEPLGQSGLGWQLVPGRITSLGQIATQGVGDGLPNGCLDGSVTQNSQISSVLAGRI